jgi:peptidoglycan/xylan/chitin deacetylase (PgdA/CDA1 family)
MLRQVVKTGLASAVHWSGAYRLLAGRRASGYPPLVIGYHRVVDRLPVDGERLLAPMAVSRATFLRHLEWLEKRFRFVSLDEAAERLAANQGFPEPAVAITFDDGYQDVYRNAFPILKRRGIPATVFVVTGFVGTMRSHTADRLFEALEQVYEQTPSPQQYLEDLFRRRRIRWAGADGWSSAARTPEQALELLLGALPQEQIYRLLESLEARTGQDKTPASRAIMTWNMLAEMQAAGVTIGSHTQSHPWLTNETPERVLEEAHASRRELEERMKIKVRHFAYPAGYFNRAIVRQVADSGYEFAYTACTHRDPDYPLLSIPRVLLWENSGRAALDRQSPAVLNCVVHSVFDRFSPCRRDHSRGAAT